jgi:hypothetical protein
VGLVRTGVVALLLAEIVCGTTLGTSISRADLLIDPEVRTLVGAGRTRVLVMLQVPAASDQAQRAEAIGRTQEAVLARLPQVRQYESVPMLALEIDATALQALETMADVVAGVKVDRAAKSQ